MGREWTRPILRGVKASVFLLAVSVVSGIVIIQSPRPTRAEGLLYTVTCTVGSLLQRDCPSKPVEGNSGQTNPSTQQPSAPAPAPAPAPSTPDQQTSSENTSSPIINQATPAPLELDEALRGDLPTIAQVSPVSATNYRYPAHVLTTLNLGSGQPEVLGASIQGPALEATEQGWRLLGLLWYWWVVIIGGVIGLGALIKTTVTNSFFSIVK